MAVREGKWRCPYCSVVNRGADLACTACGATRDKDVAFFLDDDAPEVTDEALLEKARAGADWLCQFCQTSNRPGHPRCANCGAERGTSPSRPESEIRTEPPPPPRDAPWKGGCAPRLVALLLLLAAGFCAVAGYFALRKTEETVKVAGFEWERAIEVESFRTAREQAWEGEVPSGGRPISRSREVHHTERERVGTERVKVGTRDKGNGFFEDVYEERPVFKDRRVYRNKVTYELERWVTDRTEKASGRDQTPRWPDPRLGPRERGGNRAEKYVVLLQGKKVYRMEFPRPDRWSSLKQGQTLSAVIRGGSTVLELR